MLLYEMFAIGIAVVLVLAAIGGLAARVMMGPEEMALLRLARAAEAQRQLVASAAQRDRDARAAAAQRRLVASAAHQDDWIRRCLKRQYEDALAAPLSPRLAQLITQLETIRGRLKRNDVNVGCVATRPNLPDQTVFAVWIAETKSALKRTLLCHFLLVARTYSRDAEAFIGHAGNFSRQPPKRLGFATPPPFTPM